MTILTTPLYSFSASGYKLKANLSDTNSQIKKFVGLWNELKLSLQGKLSISGKFSGLYSDQIHMNKKDIESNQDIVSGNTYSILDNTVSIQLTLEEGNRFTVLFKIMTDDFFEKYSMNKLESTIESFLFNKERAMFIDKIEIDLKIPQIIKQFNFL